MLWGGGIPVPAEYMQELFVAEIEMLLPHDGPGSPGEGVGGRPEMEVIDEGTVCRMSGPMACQLQAEIR